LPGGARERAARAARTDQGLPIGCFRRLTLRPAGRWTDVESPRQPTFGSGGQAALAGGGARVGGGPGRASECPSLVEDERVERIAVVAAVDAGESRMAAGAAVVGRRGPVGDAARHVPTRGTDGAHRTRRDAGALGARGARIEAIGRSP